MEFFSKFISRAHGKSTSARDGIDCLPVLTLCLPESYSNHALNIMLFDTEQIVVYALRVWNCTPPPPHKHTHTYFYAK